MDKAIFSAAIAITLFALTQILLHLRSRQTFLRDKLEALFTAMNEVSRAATNLGRAIHSKDEEKIAESATLVDQSLYDPRSLLLLYFPYFVDLWESSVVTSFRGICRSLNETTLDEDFDPQPLVDTLNGLSLTIRTLQNFLSKNQEFTTESFSFYWNLIVRKRVRLRISKTAHDQIVEQVGADQPATAPE
jgi:hypothetical protein